MKYVFLFLKELKRNRLTLILFILGISFITIGVILMVTVRYDYKANDELQNEYAGMSKTSPFSKANFLKAPQLKVYLFKSSSKL